MLAATESKLLSTSGRLPNGNYPAPAGHRLCYQEAGLFPHFTVAQNVALVLLENWMRRG